jgi:site-specific recombinase XerD
MPSEIHSTIRAVFAQSTHRQYVTNFKRFAKFCTQNSCAFSNVTIAFICLFLQQFVQNHSSFSYIKSLAAAIRYFFDRSSFKIDFDSPIFKDFMKGARRLSPIPKEKLTIWDPRIVLNFILDQPLPVTFFDAAEEAVVLLQLATGVRVDCLTKIGINIVPCPNSVTYKFFKKRKCPINNRYTSCLDLPDYHVSRICPNRAVIRFIDISWHLRNKLDPSLFISSLGDGAAPQTIRRWAMKLLFKAGIRNSAGSIRSAATSLAAFQGISFDDIFKTAGWSRGDTFRIYYLRPVISQVQNLMPKAV